MAVTTLIYDPGFLKNAEDWLNLSPDGDISAYAKAQGHKPLPPGLIADFLWRKEHGVDRPAAPVIRPRVVLLRDGSALPARLKLEYITTGMVSGTIYPSAAMAGICSDTTWDGALGAAQRLANEKGFGLPPGADVRWSLLLTDEEGNDLPYETQRMTPGSEITGPSAGAAFLLGLYYLHHAVEAPSRVGGREQRDFERLLPLLILPELPQSGTLQPLDAESARRKLQLLCHWENAILIFPDSLPQQAPNGSLLAGTIAELIRRAEERLRVSRLADTIPWSRRVKPYIGPEADVNALAALLRREGIVVVDGGGGMGKTTRVLEAASRCKELGAFPDGLIWTDLYEAEKSGLRLDHTLHRAVIGTLIRKEEERNRQLNQVDQYPTAVRTLLARPRVLILIEGAEVVPEADIPALLDVLVGQCTVVWLTRRSTDSDLGCFSRARRHRIQPMTLDDSLELMSSHAGRTAPIPAAERPVWLDIVRMAEQTPLFLKWAGRSLAEWETTAAELAAELRSTPLADLADPAARLEENARRFFEKALARIRATADRPQLPELARRFFAALHVFDPSHGAPRDLWSIAAGLELSTAADRRAGVAARRALRSMGLIHEDETGSQPVARPVHALAGSVCASLWQDQPLNLSAAILTRLTEAADARISGPRPEDWALDPFWQQECATLAAHFVRWTAQEGFPAHSGNFWDAFAEIIDAQPVFRLRVAVAEARMAQITLLAAHGMHSPMTPATSFVSIGDAFRAALDWQGARDAFGKALAIDQSLAAAHPGVPDFQRGLSVSWDRIGDVCKAAQDWQGARDAFGKALAIDQSLAAAHPGVPDFQRGLAVSWVKIGDVCKAAQDWQGARDAFGKALAIWQALAAAHPAVPDFQRGLAVSWVKIGDVCKAAQDWQGARDAFGKALAIDQSLAAAHPGVPDFQFGLGVCKERAALVARHDGDWARALEIFQGASMIYRELSRVCPGALGYPDAAMEMDNAKAECELELGHNEAAAASAAAARLAAGSRVASYPTVPLYREQLAIAWQRHGQIADRQGQHQAARRHWEHAVDVAGSLAREYSCTPANVALLATMQLGLTRACAAAGDAAAAAAAAKEGRQTAAALRELLRQLGGQLTGDQEQTLRGLDATGNGVSPSDV
jgi:tetratricopeptide (TPR) repeat protein